MNRGEQQGQSILANKTSAISDDGRRTKNSSTAMSEKCTLASEGGKKEKTTIFGTETFKEQVFILATDLDLIFTFDKNTIVLLIWLLL